MKTKFVILFGFLALCISANTYTQPVFLNRFSGSGNGNNIGTAITVDTTGNTYITGYTINPVTGHDITTLKYDGSGALVWSAVYNGAGNSLDEAYGIARDGADNIYVTGTSMGAGTDKDMVTIKYNKGGAQQWVMRYSSAGSHPDVSNAITLDAAGNPIVAGYSYGTGGSQMTVIKYDPAGNQLWVRTGDGTTGTNALSAITVDNSSNIYVTGYTLSASQGSYKNFMTAKYNSSGTRQWVATSNGDCTNTDGEAYSLVNDGAGNTYITGYVITYSDGKDYVTIKYNTSGVQQWLKTYNNAAANSDDIARKIIYTGTDVVVTGSSKSSAAANSEDYLTVKYRGSDGNQMFALRYDNMTAHSADIAYSITKFGTGMYYVTGSSRQTTAAGSEDIVTLAISSSGTLQTTFRITNAGPDCANDITTDKNGNFMIAGFLASLPNAQRKVSDMVCAKYGTGSYNPGGGNMIALTDLGTGNPNNFSLYQNYPNPFNPSTTVKFDVSRASNVKIAVYDILGREVLAPVNEFMNPGSYEVTLSLNSLASGLYFYRMTAGNYSEIRKLALTK